MTSSSTFEIAVPSLERRERVDAWLVKAFAEEEAEALSRSRITTLIRQGNLAINGEVVTDAALRIGGGELVRLVLPPPAAATPTAEDIPLSILFEDADLLVIDKPVGMVVHPGAGVHSGTLVNAILHHCAGDLSGIGGVARPGIVHRLDRDTSGVMVVAKNDAAHRSLAQQFADHGRTGVLEREYQALVWGRPVPPAGKIDLPLGRDPRERTRRAVSSGKDARSAVTHYRTERAFAEATLVRCRLETGRTHQIRVHMAEIGHPLLADPVYGGAFRSKADRLRSEARELLRQMRGQALHAATLQFAHPRTNETMRFETPVPDPMAALIKALN